MEPSTNGITEPRRIETSTRQRLGWGLIGCGWVARDYVAPGIVTSCNGRLIAVCDPDPEATDRILRRLDGHQPRVFRDWSGLLADLEIDAVYVSTPNHLHRAAVEAAAAAGKHVLCEKPMATRLEEARLMVDACRLAGVTYATAFDQRFHAAHRRLAELIVEGELGIVTQAHIRYACWLPRDWVTDNWRVDPVRAGGGALIDLAPHGIDLLETILDDEFLELTGFRQSIIHDYDVDDGAALVGRFRGGALATLQVGYNCPDSFPRRVLEVVGTQAMAVAEDTMGQTPGGTLTLIDARSGDRRAIAIAKEEDRCPFATQVETFARSILKGTPYPFLPDRDLRLFELLEAACP